MRVLLQTASTRPTLLDVFQPMLILVQQIVVKVHLMFTLRRLLAFVKEVDTRLQYQVPGLSFFAELRVAHGQSKHAYQPWQGKTLQHKCQQDQREGEIDDQASLRKRTSIVERERQ